MLLKASKYILTHLSTSEVSNCLKGYRLRYTRMEKLYTPEQVAELLQVEAETVRQWIRKKRLKAVKAGARLWRVRESEVEKFLSHPGKTK
jgi:excisionase family DNA binding protein